MCFLNYNNYNLLHSSNLTITLNTVFTQHQRISNLDDPDEVHMPKGLNKLLFECCWGFDHKITFIKLVILPNKSHLIYLSILPFAISLIMSQGYGAAWPNPSWHSTRGLAHPGPDWSHRPTPTHTNIFRFSNEPKCMFLMCMRKTEDPEETHIGSEKHINSTQADLNPEPSRCGATMYPCRALLNCISFKISLACKRGSPLSFNDRYF